MVGNLISAIRRNHALEHGTVMLMINRLGSGLRLAGRATPDGFYVYGRVPTEVLTDCAYEALARFKSGEAGLAVTPLCGTNIAVGGVLAGLGAAMALRGSSRYTRLPNACTAAAFGIVASQPIGRLVQQHLTTRADLDDVEIATIRRGLGGRVHKVVTKHTARETA